MFCVLYFMKEKDGAAEPILLTLNNEQDLQSDGKQIVLRRKIV